MQFWNTWGVAVLIAACGGGKEAGPRTPAETATPTSERTRASDMLMVKGTIGGLDKQAVHAVIQKAQPDVARCIRKGQKKLPFLGGQLGISITVGSTGRATEVYLHDSTLGDHEVEACVVKAFRKQSWPRPVGGKLGKVEQTFEFTAGHSEPPSDWTADTLEAGMAQEAEGDEKPFDELMQALNACRSEARTGPLQVTMYLDEDGFALSVGMAISDARGTKAITCVVTTMRTTSFPAPGDNYAKVTVQVR